MRAVDTFIARLCILAIRAYQLILSPFVRRECLFHPTCSNRAISTLRAQGARLGIGIVRAQLRDCDGRYSLTIAPPHGILLIASSGRVYGESDVATSIKARVLRFAATPPRPSSAGSLKA